MWHAKSYCNIRLGLSASSENEKGLLSIFKIYIIQSLWFCLSKEEFIQYVQILFCQLIAHTLLFIFCYFAIICYPLIAFKKFQKREERNETYSYPTSKESNAHTLIKIKWLRWPSTVYEMHNMKHSYATSQSPSTTKHLPPLMHTVPLRDKEKKWLKHRRSHTGPTGKSTV